MLHWSNNLSASKRAFNAQGLAPSPELESPPKHKVLEPLREAQFCPRVQTRNKDTHKMNRSENKTELPPDMTFGEAQIISISAYIPLFVISAFLNIRVLMKLWHTKRTNGLSRLNQLLMHLVLADLSVSFFLLNLPAKSYLISLRISCTICTHIKTNKNGARLS